MQHDREIQEKTKQGFEVPFAVKVVFGLLAVALLLYMIVEVGKKFFEKSNTEDSINVGSHLNHLDIEGWKLRKTQGEGRVCTHERTRRVPVRLQGIDGPATLCCNRDNGCGADGYANPCCDLIILALIEKLMTSLPPGSVAFHWPNEPGLKYTEKRCAAPHIILSDAAFHTVRDTIIPRYEMEMEWGDTQDHKKFILWSNCNGLACPYYFTPKINGINHAMIAGMPVPLLLNNESPMAPSFRARLNALPWRPAKPIPSSSQWPWSLAYVINVWNRPDRRAYAVNVGRRFNIPFTIIEAWTPAAMRLEPDLVDINPRHATLSTEGLAVSLTAHRAWEIALETAIAANLSEDAYVLFAEDDWSPRPDFTEYAPQLATDLASVKPDVARLGRQPLGGRDDFETVEGAKLLVRASQGSGAWAYLVRVKALSTLIQGFFPVRYPLDFVIPTFDAGKWPPRSHYDDRYSKSGLLMVDAQTPSAEPDLPNRRRGLIDECSTFEWKHSTSSDKRF